MGKIFIIVGVILVLVGLLLQFFPKLPFPGKLPGDIVVDRGNVRFYFPIATSILLSILLTLVLYFIQKGKQ